MLLHVRGYGDSYTTAGLMDLVFPLREDLPNGYQLPYNLLKLLPHAYFNAKSKLKDCEHE